MWTVIPCITLGRNGIRTNKAKKNLKDEGCVVHEMIIDIDELNLYCIERGVMNDGRARSQYVAQLPLSQKKK